MNYKVTSSVLCASMLLLASCSSSPTEPTSTGTGSLAQISSAKEPNELQQSVPETKLKFNNLFYGQPLRLETEKTKCRKANENKLCGTPFKLYHIGDVSELHYPLLQVLLLDTGVKDPALGSYMDFITKLINGDETKLDPTSDLLAKFNDEKVALSFNVKRGSISNQDFASYYSVVEKNKKNLLYYTVAKKVKNTVVVIRFGAGLNTDSNKESFSTYSACGKSCTLQEKALSYVGKKESFAAYQALLEKVQKMLVSFE